MSPLRKRQNVPTMGTLFCPVQMKPVHIGAILTIQNKTFTLNLSLSLTLLTLSLSLSLSLPNDNDDESFTDTERSTLTVVAKWGEEEEGITSRQRWTRSAPHGNRTQDR